MEKTPTCPCASLLKLLATAKRRPSPLQAMLVTFSPKRQETRSSRVAASSQEVLYVLVIRKVSIALWTDWSSRKQMESHDSLLDYTTVREINKCVKQLAGPRAHGVSDPAPTAPLSFFSIFTSTRARGGPWDLLAQNAPPADPAERPNRPLGAPGPILGGANRKNIGFEHHNKTSKIRG